MKEAGKARFEAKEDKATIEICSTELRSGETTARLPGGQFYGIVAYMLGA